MAQRARHYNRNMGLKTWKKWTDWPLMVLSVVFLVVYSWEILSRTHIALCETVINVIWVVFVVDYVVSLWLADDRWRWFKHNLFTLLTIALPMLRPLRLLRLLTVLHVLNRTSGMAVRGRITVYARSARWECSCTWARWPCIPWSAGRPDPRSPTSARRCGGRS